MTGGEPAGRDRRGPSASPPRPCPRCCSFRSSWRWRGAAPAAPRRRTGRCRVRLDGVPLRAALLTRTRWRRRARAARSPRRHWPRVRGWPRAAAAIAGFLAAAAVVSTTTRRSSPRRRSASTSRGRSPRPRRAGWRSRCGGIPPAALLLYHQRGVRLAVAHRLRVRRRPGAEGGLPRRSSAPTPGRLYQAFVAPSNGLFVLAPWVLLAFVGAVRARRDAPETLGVRGDRGSSTSRSSARPCPSSAARGWSVGPRYIAVAMPFLAWLAVAGARVRRGAARPGASSRTRSCSPASWSTSSRPRRTRTGRSASAIRSTRSSFRLLGEGRAPHSLGTLVGLHGLALAARRSTPSWPRSRSGSSGGAGRRSRPPSSRAAIVLGYSFFPRGTPPDKNPVHRAAVGAVTLPGPAPFIPDRPCWLERRKSS